MNRNYRESQENSTSTLAICSQNTATLNIIVLLLLIYRFYTFHRRVMNYESERICKLYVMTNVTLVTKVFPKWPGKV